MLKVLFIIVSTVIGFLVMTKFYRKFPHPLTMPIITTTVLTVIVLLFFEIPYANYMEGGKWIQSMLGPAVVALAYPLYNQREIVMRYKYSILFSIVIAMVIGIISVMAFMLLFGVSKELMLTAIPKSLTTPVAMQVSESIGGIPPLTAVLVMLAGVIGALVGPTIIKYAKIDSAISRGVAIGSASHGVGIAKLKDYGEQELSIGSLAMGLSAVCGAFICPLFVYLFF